MWAQIEGSEVKLYGRIYNGDAQYIVSDLNTFFKKNANATVRLHTPGGSVFDGNLIFNTLANSKSNIHIIIDGLAASMGSILILAGNKVSMAENGFIMIHEPSGGIEGNAKAFESGAKLLRSIESNFIKKFVAKTKKTEDEIKAWMDGDNWFSADEALEAGLIDEIIEPVIENLNVNAYTEYNLVALTDAFKEFEKKPANEVKSNNSQTQTTNKKMKLNTKSLEILALSEGASENDINAAIEKLHAEKVKMQKESKEKTDKEIEAILGEAIKSGKILASEKDDFKSLLEGNLEAGKKAIEKLPAKPSLGQAAQQENKDSSSEERKDWTFEDWRKKDTKGLLAIKKDDPDRYQKIIQIN